MKKTILYALVALCAVLTLGSCAGQRALTGQVDGISARLDAELKAFKLDESAGGTIKMKRGEAIQITLSKFGIEGARIVCTPDSILFVNKLTKTYLRSSFRDADKALTGGEGTLNFANVEAYFWNETKGSSDALISVGGLFPIELHTAYGGSLRVGEHRLPTRINLKVQAADGTLQPGRVRLKLSKVKATEGWTPNTNVPAKYKSLNVVKLLKGLLSSTRVK